MSGVKGMETPESGASKMSDDQSSESNLKLYITPEHPCSYLPNHQAKTLFVDPTVDKNPWLYQALIDMGFRRSGGMIYRPECDGCQACVPARIPISTFKPNRAQRRTWNRGIDQFTMKIKTAGFEEGHYVLYESYIKSRHPDGDMAETSRDKYRDFLICDWNDTAFIEFRSGNQLVAVAVTDLLPDGLSAVYTFFDPAMSKLGPGVFALLWQIEYARALKKTWLYLGYWVPGCAKMEYKNRYQPLQIYLENEWRVYDEHSPPTLETLSTQLQR